MPPTMKPCLVYALAVAAAAGLCAEGARKDVAVTELSVATVPPGAVVVCDGVVRSESPLTLSDLAPGEHLIAARKDGFEESRRTVSVEAGQRSSVELKLDPILGLLLVHTDPAGADLQVDGADRGQSPALISDLPVGRYRLHVASTGYLPKDIDLVVDSRTPQKIDVKLTPDSATVVITSDPPGARVTLNGLDKGVAPCTLERIPAGDCTLQLVLDGCAPYEQTLKLAAGQTEQIKAVLAPIPSELSIVSIPPGARIYVENQFRGESPVTLKPMAPGTYRVRAELAGYEPQARDIVLQRASSLTEEFRLGANSGQIRITTEPAGVTVFVDGKERGVTAAGAGETDRVSEPIEIGLLSAGQHEIELTRTGFFSKKVTLEVEKDKTVTLHQNLERRFIPNYEVRTASEVIRGVLLEVNPMGDIRLEVRPGIVKTVPAAEVREKGPLREPAP